MLRHGYHSESKDVEGNRVNRTTVLQLRLQFINSGGGVIFCSVTLNFQKTDNFMTMGQIHLKGRFTAGVGLTIKFQYDQSILAQVNVGFLNKLKKCHLEMNSNNIQY